MELQHSPGTVCAWVCKQKYTYLPYQNWHVIILVASTYTVLLGKKKRRCTNHLLIFFIKPLKHVLSCDNINGVFNTNKKVIENTEKEKNTHTSHELFQNKSTIIPQYFTACPKLQFEEQCNARQTRGLAKEINIAFEQTSLRWQQSTFLKVSRFDLHRMSLYLYYT